MQNTAVQEFAQETLLEYQDQMKLLVVVISRSLARR